MAQSLLVCVHHSPKHRSVCTQYTLSSTAGVCAMEKKARSPAMMEMLNRMTSFVSSELQEFSIVFFSEDT